MDTFTAHIDREDIDEEIIRKAGDVIRYGGLVAFPTETVYGLGGDALNENSSERIYAAKGRPSDNPLIVHIADFDSIEAIASLDDKDYPLPDIGGKVRALNDRFWPGPLTIILKKKDIVPYKTTGGLDTVAIRMPHDDIALGLIRASGGYIAAPSANLSGRPSPTKASHVIEDMDGRIDMILDGGDVDIGLESTIVDMTEDEPAVLRPGAITVNDLSKVLGTVIVDPAVLGIDTHAVPRAPGMRYRHYAPKGELAIVKGEEDEVTEYINSQCAAAKSDLLRTGVICADEHVLRYRATSVKCAGRRDDGAFTARRLYAVLREFDEEQIDVIYSESFDEGRLGQAIMNRLLKAAGHKVIDLSK